ncbi:hypothetical protein ACUODF_50260, partial [Escherichia coli]
MNQPLLSVNNLTHLYAPGKGFSDVSFNLWPGEVLGIVGESGSGNFHLFQPLLRGGTNIAVMTCPGRH